MATKIDILVLTVLSVELAAAHAIFPLTDEREVRTAQGTRLKIGSLYSYRKKATWHVGIATIGSAGNVNAAVATTELIMEYAPKLVILAGIACGMKDKTKIGQVLIAERVAYYEPQAQLTETSGGSKSQGRPDTYRIEHRVQQDVSHYAPPPERLKLLLDSSGNGIPLGSTDIDQANIVTELGFKVATIASGEILWKNTEEFKKLRDTVHGKIEAADMEGYGVAESCERASTPWLIVRGISDFGDDRKGDNMQPFAAESACVIATDFLQHGLDFPTSTAATKSLELVWQVENTNIESFQIIFGIKNVGASTLKTPLVRIHKTATFDPLHLSLLHPQPWDSHRNQYSLHADNRKSSVATLKSQTGHVLLSGDTNWMARFDTHWTFNKKFNEFSFDYELVTEETTESGTLTIDKAEFRRIGSIHCQSLN